MHVYIYINTYIIDTYIYIYFCVYISNTISNVLEELNHSVTLVSHQIHLDTCLCGICMSHAFIKWFQFLLALPLVRPSSVFLDPLKEVTEKMLMHKSTAFELHYCRWSSSLPSCYTCSHLCVIIRWLKTVLWPLSVVAEYRSLTLQGWTVWPDGGTSWMCHKISQHLSRCQMEKMLLFNISYTLLFIKKPLH
jgi:hypothetical protein